MIQDGSNTGDFIVGALSATDIPAGGGSVTFTVTFSPTASSTPTTTLRIASNVVRAKNHFDISLQGFGVAILETCRQLNHCPAPTNTGDAANHADPHHTAFFLCQAIKKRRR